MSQFRQNATTIEARFDRVSAMLRTGSDYDDSVRQVSRQLPARPGEACGKLFQRNSLIWCRTGVGSRRDGGGRPGAGRPPPLRYYSCRSASTTHEADPFDAEVGDPDARRFEVPVGRGLEKPALVLAREPPSGCAEGADVADQHHRQAGGEAVKIGLQGENAGLDQPVRVQLRPRVDVLGRVVD